MGRWWWPLAVVGVLSAQSPKNTTIPSPSTDSLRVSNFPAYNLTGVPMMEGVPDTSETAASPVSRTPHSVKLVRDKINAFRWAAKPENTHLASDRTVYHAGDSLYFAVFVHEHTRFSQPYSERLYVALVGPRNDTVFSRPLAVRDGQSWGAAELPHKIPPGIYRLVAFTEWMRRNNRPYSVRPVVVMPERRPPLRVFVKWDKERFFIGENVEARIYVKSLDETGEEERPWGRKNLTVVWREGRQTLHEERLTTDDFGLAKAKFAPNETPLGLSMVVKVEYDGTTDEVRYLAPYCDSRAVNLRFFPEGGKMFAGLKNRVAFKATYADGSPAQVSGDVVLPDGRTLTRFETLHAGMGEFFVEVKEAVGLTALLKTPQPAAAAKSVYPLPAFAKSGHYIHFDEKVFRLAATRPEKVVFCVVLRDSVILAQQLFLQPTPRDVRWKGVDAPSGLARAQIFSTKGKLLAERIFFHRSGPETKIEIETDRVQYFPGDKVNSVVWVKGEKGKVTSARGVLTAAAQRAAHVPAFPLPPERTGGAFAGDLVQNPSLNARYLLETESPVPIPGLDAILQKDKALDLLMLVHPFRTVPWAEKDEPGPAKHKPEKNTISAVVMDAASRAPIANIVRVYDALGTFYVPTGNDGRFTVSELDLEARGGLVEFRFRYAGQDKDCHRKFYYDYCDDDTVWVDDMTAYLRETNFEATTADFFAQDAVAESEKDKFPYPPTPKPPPPSEYVESIFGKGIWDAEGTYVSRASEGAAPSPVLHKKAHALTDSADYDPFEHEELLEDQDPETLIFKVFPDSDKVVWKTMPAVAAPKNGRFLAYWSAASNVVESQTYSWTQPSQTGLYEIRFRGMDDKGRPVEGKTTYRCAEPFQAEAVLPAACAANDIVKIPITVHNRTSENQTCSVRVRLPAKLIPNTPPVFSLDVPAQKKVVKYVDVLTHQSVGRDSIRIEVEGGRYRRVISAPVKLRHKTLDARVAFTGNDKEASATLETNTPAKFALKAYPTPAAELVDASKGLEDCGEPTIESAAARIGIEFMLLDYLRRNEHTDNPQTQNLRIRAEAVIRRATALLADLLNTDGAVDPPADPVRGGTLALWALRTLENAGYEVRGIPKPVVVAERLSEACRISRPKSLDVWMLAEAGYRRGLETLWASGERNGAYVLAALRLNRRVEAQTALIALMRRQAPDGGVENSIDETALFLTALLRFGLDDVDAADRANRAMDFILRRRRADGAFGGPLSTFLALVARYEYVRHGEYEKDFGMLTVHFNADKAVTLEFHTAQYEPVYLNDLEKYAKPDKNVVKVVFQETPNYIPYVFTAESAGEVKVNGEAGGGYDATLRAEWSRPSAAAGKEAALSVAFSASGNVLLRTALPAGLVPDEVKFDALVAENKIKARDYREGELWVWPVRGADAFVLPLKAVLPGEYGETAVLLSPAHDPGAAVGAVLPPFDVFK